MKTKLKINKMLMIMILFIVSFLTVNATPVYLNDCGATLLSNTEYIINMTEGTYTPGAEYCFSVGSGSSNITITGLNQTLDFVDNTKSFTWSNVGSSTTLQKIRYNNLILENLNALHRSRVSARSPYSHTLRDFNITHVLLNNADSIIDFGVLRDNGFPAGSIPWVSIDFKFDEFVFLNTNGVYQQITDGYCYLSCNYPRIMGYFHTTNFISDNSVWVSPFRFYGDSNLMKGFRHNDTDNNNIANDEISGSNTNSNIYKDLFGYTFAQDVEEGRIAYDTETDKRIIFIENSNLNYAVSDLVLNDNSNNYVKLESDSDWYLNTGKSIQLGTYTGLDCTILSSQYCFIQDNSSGSIPGTFRPLITIASHTLISNAFIEKTVSNTYHLIANDADNTKTNVSIIDSFIKRNDNRDGDGDSQLIKLKGNNINIEGNVFETAGLDDTAYELLYIDSNAPTSNTVTLNNFTSQLNSGSQQVFSTECDTNFYNNWLDTLFDITFTCSGVNASPMIPYLHTDDKVYYFQIGNYYVSNTGCVDVNPIDGICDSSFLSGSITDTHPLSSYPFNFVSHLLTADYIVDNLSFTITLENIIDNETVNLTDAGSTIILQFSHDSNFPDLTCDYFLDGSPIIGSTIFNTPKTTIHDYSKVGGWTEKAYTYRVECYNDLAGETSSEYTFHVTIGDGAPPDDDDNGVSGGVFAGAFTGTSIIDFSDPAGTAEDTLGFFENFILFSLNYIVPFAIILIMLLIILAIFIMVA